jgi:hypothetical protein
MGSIRTAAVLAVALGASTLGAQGTTAISGVDIGHVAPVITVSDPRLPSESTPDVGYANPIYQAPPGTGFDGVARLLMTDPDGYVTSGCSGSLLWTGQDILTAAHCVTSGSNAVTASAVYSGFMNADGSVTNIKSSAIYVNPLYNGGIGADPNGSPIDPNDIAIIHLSAPATGITGYDLYTGNPMSQPTVFAGFGLTGNGVVGGQVNNLFDDLVDGSQPVRRIAVNQWDATLSADGSTIYNDFESPIMMSDFDDGTLVNNTLCNFFGGPTNPYGLSSADLNNVCNSGAGKLEGSIDEGDSGGPGLIWNSVTGKFEIAGVASFGDERCYDVADNTSADFNVDGTCPVGYDFNGGYFGSLSAHVDPAVGDNMVFIASVTPEPTSFALLGTGLLVLLPAANLRRRRKH